MTKAVQKAICVFAYFGGWYKKSFGYNFVAPLSYIYWHTHVNAKQELILQNI